MDFMWIKVIPNHIILHLARKSISSIILHWYPHKIRTDDCQCGVWFLWKFSSFLFCFVYLLFSRPIRLHSNRRDCILNSLLRISSEIISLVISGNDLIWNSSTLSSQRLISFGQFYEAKIGIIYNVYLIYFFYCFHCNIFFSVESKTIFIFIRTTNNKNKSPNIIIFIVVVFVVTANLPFSSSLSLGLLS